MSYQDKFAITDIRKQEDRFDALSISTDYETNPKKTYPVFLYTPDMENTREHYHIHLSPEQAVILRDWLIAYCDDPNRLPLDDEE